MNQIKTKIILYTAIATTALLAFVVVPPPTNTNIGALALYASAISGYAGIMLLLWNLVLGSRSVTSLVSPDLATVQAVHKWIGKYGTLLIFAHPLLIMLSFGESLAYVFWPELDSVLNNAVTYGRSALWILLVVWVSSALLRSRLSYRPWKYLHFAAYAAIPFALLHIPLTGSSYATTLGVRIYFFIVLIGFLVFGLLRLRGALNLNKSHYVITAQQKAAEDIYTLTLSPKNKATPVRAPKPGQYVYLKVGAAGEDHPFSVMEYHQSNGDIVIGYKVYGPFTHNLSGLKNGTTVLLSGPFGTFTHNPSHKKTVFIAGGIGITPFIHPLMGTPDNGAEQWLFYANRTPESAPYLAKLQQVLDEKCVSVFSRQQQTSPTVNDRKTTHTGRINGALIQKYLSQPQQYAYYICGPEGMILDMRRDLTALGVSKDAIHSESFAY